MQLPAASVLVISAGDIQSPDSMSWQVKDLTANFKKSLSILISKPKQSKIDFHFFSQNHF